MKSSDKKYQARVRELGCIICERPASLHHIRDGVGKGQKASDRDVLPLCPDHHTQGGYGIAFHAGKEVWQDYYGKERKLLLKVRKKLDELL